MLFNRDCCMQEPRMNCCQPTNACQPADPCRQPIMEPVMTNCVEREFYHEVPHVCPFHTHVVNRHIYKHTYTPQYSCSEENQVCNIDPGCCGGR